MDTETTISPASSGGSSGGSDHHDSSKSSHTVHTSNNHHSNGALPTAIPSSAISNHGMEPNVSSSAATAACTGTMTPSAGTPIEKITEPNKNDVLCGRGGSINSHHGNEQFRKLVDERKRVYLTARFKREKRLIATSIVSEIREMDPPGRFLARKGNMKDTVNGYWYDIGDEKARDKTSQALRENAPSIRAEIETEIHKQRAEMKLQEQQQQQQQQQQLQHNSNAASAAAAAAVAAGAAHGFQPQHSHPMVGHPHAHPGHPHAIHPHHAAAAAAAHHHHHHAAAAAAAAAASAAAAVAAGGGMKPSPHFPPPVATTSNQQQKPNMPTSNPQQGKAPVAHVPVPTSGGAATNPVVAANAASAYAQYAQQYYDYYYHYYGYGAPPPPPPPGYPGGPPAYPGAPTPPAYWPGAAGPAAAAAAGVAGTATGATAHATASSNSNNNNRNKAAEETKDDAMMEDAANVGSTASGKASTSKGGSATKSSSSGSSSMKRSLEMTMNNVHAAGSKRPLSNATAFFGISQEEQDRRMALELQQEENAKAFDERNKQFGSDRRASRSSAFCAPGYRPRLLHDESSIGPHSKRPAMSNSMHFSSARTNNSSSTFGSPSKKAPPSTTGTPTNDNVTSGVATASASTESDILPSRTQEDRDLKLAMALQQQEDAAVRSQMVAKDSKSRKSSRSSAYPQFSSTAANRSNTKDHSTSSFGFDSIVASFTRGTKIAPMPNDSPMDTKPSATDKNGAMVTPGKSTGNDNQLHDPTDPLMNHDHSIASAHSRLHFKEDTSDMFSLFGGDGSTANRRRAAAPSQTFTPIAGENGAPDQSHSTAGDSTGGVNSSMWTQVANQLLGTFNASWTDSDHAGSSHVGTKHPVPNNRPTAPPATSTVMKIIPKDERPDNRDTSENQIDIDAEMGTEVVMEVRDSNGMTQSHRSGTNTDNIITVDWATCGMSDTIGASASAFFGNDSLEQQQDHSLLSRISGMARGPGQDISPVNSIDMDFSHSYQSIGGTIRRRRADGTSIGRGSSSIMNVFEQKTSQNCHNHAGHSTNIFDLKQIPSWERDLTGRSVRSRSPTLSLNGGGSFDPLDGDDSLIRVDSMDVKEKHNALNQFLPVVPNAQHHSSAKDSPEQRQAKQSMNSGNWSPMPPPPPMSHGHQQQQSSTPHYPAPAMMEDETMDWSAGE